MDQGSAAEQDRGSGGALRTRCRDWWTRARRHRQWAQAVAQALCRVGILGADGALSARTHRRQAVQGPEAKVKLRARTQCRGLEGGSRQGRLRGV